MLKKQLYLFFIITTLTIFNCFSQNDLNVKVTDTIVNNSYEFNPLSPSKAAFYSAVLPGLGQAYNRKYWKIPIVYAALGTGVGIYIWNNNQYHDFRDAYKLRRNGKPDEYSYLSESTLITAQKSYKQDRDLTLLITVGMYVLQIIEASVNAHLLQHNVDNNLSFKPKLINNRVTNKSMIGASINYNF